MTVSGAAAATGRAGRTGLRLGWALAALCWAGAAIWLFAHPPSLSTDDALYLARGLSRFSVLEQSPQFPGYPGFILMGRLLLPLAGSPERALALLAGGIALSLPPLAALVAARGAGRGAALMAFLLVLAMPLLPELGLGLLTDGAGIAFTLVFIALLPAGGRGGGDRLFGPAPRAPVGQLVLAGIALGWAAACRPSDAVLILAAAAGTLRALPRAAGPLAAGFALVILPVAAGLLIVEPLYPAEGWRFTLGHALIWGNTPFSGLPGGIGWAGALARHPALAVLPAVPVLPALAALTRPRNPASAAVAAGFLGHAAWIALFQNAENLRHLAPLLVLGPLVLCLTPSPVTRPVAWLCLGIEAGLLATSVTPDPGMTAPLSRAAARLAAAPPNSAVATNLGVSVLRQALPRLRVYDRFYAADAALGLSLAGGGAWRLTATLQPGMTPAATFPARFPGERTLFLIPVPRLSAGPAPAGSRR